MFSHLAVRTVIITALTVALSGALAGAALAAPPEAPPPKPPQAVTPPATVTATLNGEFGGCTPASDRPSGWLVCPTSSLTGSGLLPGASATECNVTTGGCVTVENFVEADGTLPDAYASYTAYCIEGHVYTMTTTTARRTTISDSYTCTL